MKSSARSIITYATIVIVGLFFLFWGLVKAKSFLAPISVAGLLAMVILPVCRWFEKNKINRGWSSFFSVLIILLFFVGLAGVLGVQVKSFTDDWSKIKQRMEPKVEQLQKFISEKTGLSVQEQNQKVSGKIPFSISSSDRQAKGDQGGQQQDQGNQQDQSQQDQDQGQGSQQGQQGQSNTSAQQSGSSMASTAGSFLRQFMNFIGTFLLIFIYIFFFLLYRNKFRNSILKMVPEDKQKEASHVITDSMGIAQNYLFGRLILIFFLAILYSIGLSVSGVQTAILISVLAAVLSLIPYIGNIIGFVLALGMAAFSGSGMTGMVGVTVTFAVAQFVESYILEPYIVGDRVNLNPVMVIVVVVLGGAIWGIIGMLIAIPALGITKVVFDHIPALQPWGYLFGDEDIGGGEGKDNIFKKTKRWALRKFK